MKQYLLKGRENMKIFFRLLALMLALTFCCGCFAACNIFDAESEETKQSAESGETETEESSKNNTADTIEPAHEGFVIGGKKASFQVVIPDKTTATVEYAEPFAPSCGTPARP